MNYLAHARLSFGDADILTGNMISDFVKGKKKLDYPSPIRDGIALHRAIDGFTDGHEATRRAKDLFRADYRLYAGPLVDVVYDHCLANDPAEFADEGALAAFAQETYQRLGHARTFFPERFGRLFPYMESQDWLTGYRHQEGIFRSFAGLARRATYMPGPGAACETFVAHYAELEVCYYAFFPELRDFAWRTLERIREGRGIE